MKKVVLIIAVLLVVLFSGMCIADACGAIEPQNRGGMEAEVRQKPGGLSITNKNDFPWYRLAANINERYSNRILFDRGNWPWLRADSALMPGEEQWLNNDQFVYSEDDYLDPTDEWFEGQPFTYTIDHVEIEAKTKVDGEYDLRATYTFDLGRNSN